MSKMSEHNFYCIKCGKPGIPLARPQSHKRERFHRKKLYCPWCKTMVNHIECKTQDEVYEFKMDFEEGKFEEELKECLTFLQEECKCEKLCT